MNKSTEEQDRDSAEAGSRYVPLESKISRLAILSLVLGILSLLFFVLAGIPAIVIGIVSVVRVRRSRGQLKGKSIALVGVLVSIPFMCVFFLLWSLDAPPIPNDYTVADVRSAPAEYAESFEILKTLIDEDHDLPGAPAIGLTEDDLDMSAEIRGVIEDGNSAEISEILGFYADDIEKTWARMQGTRDVIKRLNAFADIADLTDLSVDSKIMYVNNFLELARFYQVYGRLKTERGDVQAFVAELIGLDSVFRKLSVNVRMFVPKLACLICIHENMVTANAIVNDTRTSMSTVELLAKHFVPLTREQMSLRNGVLLRYLMFKSAFSDGLASNTAGKVLLLKPNSTLRFYRNCCNKWFNAHRDSGEAASAILSVWPAFYPFNEPDPAQDHALLSFVYRCYNPHGLLYTGMLGFSRETIPEKSTNISVQADLLQIVLKKRLGREVSLKARAYSDEYIVDVENKKIFSPGPDGKTNTKDDIWLPINPTVLQLDSQGR
ncbi:MAG: hypothetical protein CEE38_04100 [Planctomycetes bacterium B3_Pla]|nr:MAG: hypothetical protein CEE38_04100 [Planctomycetes bacterium B3_Pla]